MAISSQNALLNQYSPPFCIGSPVDGEALLYNSSKKVWENRPITSSDLANVVPSDLVWTGDIFGPGDVVTISSDLTTFVSVPRADFGNPVSLGELSDVSLIAPLLDGEVLTFSSTTNKWTNEAAGGTGAVDSVFGRTGAVIATSGDYSTTLVTNASGVIGVTTTDALNTLDTDKADKVSGAVAGNLAGLDGNGNLTDSGIDPNDLTNLVQIGDPNTLLVNTAGYITLAQVPAAPVTSVFGRTGVVTAQAGDYSAFYATTAQGALADSSVQPGDDVSDLNNDANYVSSGANVSVFANDAGYITLAQVPAAPVTSVFGRTGIVTAQEGDYSIGQMSDVNTTGVAVGQILEWNGTNFVPGNKGTSGSTTFIGLTDTPANYTGSADKLVAVNSAGNALVFIDAPQNAPVDSVFGRTGVVVATAGDYDSSEITNDSTVTGATVTAALETLNSNLGQTNTASNVGAGTGLFAQKNGVDLEFKSLVAGTNITLSSDGTTVTVNAGSSGEVNTASNLGAGEGVFAQKSSADLEFKSLVAGTNITLSSDTDEITINAAGASSTVESIRINYVAPFGSIVSVQDATPGIISATIETGQWINFTFNTNRPPTSIIFYGYVEAENVWGYTQSMPASTGGGNRVITGGSAGSPGELLTNMANGTIRLQARATETAADAGEHAFVFFLF
jgi:hypothetical protein